MSEKIPYDLIVRHLANEANGLDRKALQDWILSDPRNQSLFLECCKTWEYKADLPTDIDLSKALRNLNRRIDVSEAKTIGTRTIWWTKAAAAILLVATCSYALFHAINVSTVSHTVWSSVFNGNEIRVMKLEDGSEITLNRESSLRYPKKFGTDTREVYLNGEAFFSVRKDRSRPFVVHSGGVRTEVLGTSFNVRSDSARLVITVVTGKVRVSDGTVSEVLKPNDQVTLDFTDRSLVRTTADIDRVLAWRADVIVFDDTNLSHALQILGERFGVSFHFDDEMMRKCAITGTFRDETLQNILDALSFSSGVTYVMRGKDVWISATGCR